MPRINKPKAIIFDMSGTAMKSGYIEKILQPYVRKNVKDYLSEMWQSNPVVQEHVENLRRYAEKQTSKHPDIPQVKPKDGDPGEIQESAAELVVWLIDNQKESRALQKFKFDMWFDGYSRAKLRTPVYSDVAINLKKWKYQDRISLIVYSNGWVEAQKVFFSHTNHGDLTTLIDKFFDNSIGKLDEPESYQKICKDIGQEPASCAFLIKNVSEAKAAKEAGLEAVLVCTHRKHVERLTEEDKQNFKKIRSFVELEFE